MLLTYGCFAYIGSLKRRLRLFCSRNIRVREFPTQPQSNQLSAFTQLFKILRTNYQDFMQPRFTRLGVPFQAPF